MTGIQSYYCNFEIWIQKNGVISADGQVLDMTGLENAVVQAVTANPGGRIHIIADRDTPYKYVNCAVNVLQTLQHRVVSFVVKDVQN